MPSYGKAQSVGRLHLGRMSGIKILRFLEASEGQNTELQNTKHLGLNAQSQPETVREMV
jgi:hypothetical protein